MKNGDFVHQNLSLDRARVDVQQLVVKHATASMNLFVFDVIQQEAFILI